MKELKALPEWMTRTIQLLGEEKVRKLQQSHVLVAGLGGVGGMATEMLARAGVGKLTLVDSDIIQPSNINRQLITSHTNIGKSKVEELSKRLKEINPELEIIPKAIYINEESIDGLLMGDIDFVVDAIDTLSPKIMFIEKVIAKGIPLASSMGSGGKTDPSKIRIADFKKTFNCRLAYILRKKLRKNGITGGFLTVFSTELADKRLVIPTENEQNKKSQLGTVSYIPAIFGSMLASIVVEGLTSEDA